MAEEIQKKKISDLPSAVYLADTDVVPVVQGSSGSETTRKADFDLISTNIAESRNFSNLTTESKTLVGAINELDAAGTPSADEVSYDNTTSGLSASDVQSAIDELAQGGGGSTVEVTQVQTTGTKIATITVDSVGTDLYAPNGGGGASALDDLSDVSIDTSTLASGQVIKYDGTSWVNGTESGGASAFEDLTDVDIDSATLSNGQVPVYNSISEKWENGTISSGSGHTILDNEGTALTQRTNLQFNGAYSEDNSTDDTTEVNVVREMTKAEFDLLSAEEKTGFINITDITGGNDDRFQPFIYSEDEREIGVWIDGKPLYEKTIDCGYLANNNDTDVAHNISNLDTVADAYAIVNRKSTNPPVYMVLPYTNSSSQYNIDFNINTTYVHLTTYSDRTNCYVYTVIRYTKTTDQAGSGQWTPQGVPAHHYSEDEQVVGTWIDGSTLYEKTVHITAFPSTTYAKTDYAHNISNIGTICFWQGIARWQNGSTVNIEHYDISSGTILSSPSIQVQIDKTNISIWVGTDRSSLNGDFVIRYTKSST